MQNREIELAVGDTVLIGDCVVTVIDIDGSDVTFRIDQVDSDELAIAGAAEIPGK